jgi:peptide/nickel transport system substrate-binding protein
MREVGMRFGSSVRQASASGGSTRRSRRRSARTWAATVVVLAVAGALVSPLANAQTPAADDELVLRVGTTVDLTSANIWAATAGSDWTLSTLQYDMMLKFASEDLSPAPSLATGCEPNQDSTVWTCTLREGLMWSDGTPLTSRDVAFSYRFVIDNKIPQYKSYFPFNPTFETPDDQTLIWNSEEPTFALDVPPWAYIVPEKVWAEYDGQTLRDIRAVEHVPAIGSGPFTLTDWQPGQGFTLERNEYFWGDEPEVDRIEFRVYSNQEAMIQALRNGEVDFADGLKPQLVASVEGMPNVTLQHVVSDWWLNLAFNFGGQSPEADALPALHDITVRQAIAMAIDKQAIADKVYQGTAAPGDTIIRPASAFWHLDIPADEELPYDPEGAAAMLEEAGYVDSDGDGVREDPETGDPLELLVPASQDTGGAVEAGELIVGFLDQIGIQVELRPVSDGKMNDYWGAGNFDAYIWYWSGDPDPNYQLFVFTSEQCGAWSDGCWKDPTFDSLYEEQRKTFDREARQEIVFEAQRRVYEQIPGVVLAYPGSLQAYRNDRFTGWVPNPGDDGYLLPGYNYDSLVSLRAVDESVAATSGGSSGIPGWIWLVAGLAVVAVIVVMSRRGRRRELDEA